MIKLLFFGRTTLNFAATLIASALFNRIRGAKPSAWPDWKPVRHLEYESV